MNYSKRQLYALGETLGDSVTQNKVGGGRIYGGGGGGGSPAPAGPTQTTVQNTNIPEYAQPYVENMLNAAQAQIYKPDMTGFNPYTPYSNNPTDYVAGFSPLQQQAQSSVANMQTSPGLGMYQGLSALAGNNYARQATSPTATQAYMNPYLNASLAPQLAEIQRQYDITGTKEMSDATRSNAFGGSREALMAAENQRNAGLAKNQAIGQGYNNAFQAAQQAQQFGANLGLQGYNQAGNLAGQQLGQEQSIANLQNQMGGQQQNQQQNVINQAVQNYATAQQYPYLQLGMLNSMLRGLPMQQATTQMYQAAPSQVSQLAGLGTAGLGAAAMYNAAKGAKGGSTEDIAGYAPGGAIPMRSYSDQQLSQVQQSPYSQPLDKLYAGGISMDRGDVRNNPQAIKAISTAMQQSANSPQAGMPPPQQVAAMPQTRTGIGALPTGDVIPQQFANGGIMSYAGDDDSDVKPSGVKKGSKGELNYSDEIARRLANLDSGKDPFAGTKEEIASIREEMKARQGMNNAQALTRFGLGMMGGQSQYGLENIGKAGLGALDYMAKTGAENAADRKLLASTVRESEAAKYQRENQNLNALIAAQSGIDSKKIGLAGVNATREGNLAMKEAQLISTASQAYTTAVKDSFRALAADEKNKFIFESNPGKLWDMARTEVYQSMPEQQRALLKLADPGASAKNPPQANPAAPGGVTPTPVPVVVTIPAKDGKPAQQVQFESQEKADAFKKAAGIKG
jgi:hypothetical protein